MRLFRRVMCLILTSCLTLGLLPVYAEDSNIIKISEASGKPGDQVNIKISIDKPDGIESFQFDLLYDDRVFNILNESDVTVSSTVQKIMPLNDFSVKNPRKLSFYAAAMPGSGLLTSTKTEEILSINFSIKSKAPLGTHVLKLDKILLYDDNAPSNHLPFSVVDGQVIVTQTSSGDEPGGDDEPSKPKGPGGGGGGGGNPTPSVTPTPTPGKDPLDDLLKEIDGIIDSGDSKDLAYDVLGNIEKYIMEACTINIDSAEVTNNIMNVSIVEDALKEAVDNVVFISEGAVELLDNLEISLEDIKTTITVKTAQKNDVNQFAFTIPAAAFEYAINCNIDSIVIDMGTNSVEIYTGAFEDAITDETENIEITVDSLDSKSLAENISALSGDRKALKFNVNVDGKQVNKYYGRNAIKVSCDYELMQGENPDKVVAYKIIDETLDIVNICAYDISSGKITFAVDSPGTYTAMGSDVTFDDITQIDWAVIPIEALAGRGIISGIGDDKFAPDRNVTREEFAKMLVEAFGFKDEAAATDLADVLEDAWYYKYVASAQKYGIVNGIGNNMFGVGTNITRQDMAVMAYRAAKAANIRIKIINDEESFSDTGEIAEYAKNSVSVMQQLGIINGIGDNMFAPMNNATRAQAARIIYLLYKNAI